MECKCVNWCRVGAEYKRRGKTGLPLYTNHHPNCEHYNKSLMKVFRVEYYGQYYFTAEKPELGEVETLTETTIHREIYEQLREIEDF